MPMPFLANDLLAALPRLRRYARLLTDDPAGADALVEETLRRARRMQDEPPPGTTAAVRLLALLRSAYAEQFAPGRPHGPLPNRDAPEAFPADADSSGRASRSSHARAGDLVAQFFRLPIEQREVLALVAVERMSYAEIAMLLDVPVATVFARLAQAREALHAAPSEPLAAPKSSG